MLATYDKVPFQIRGWWEPHMPNFPQLMKWIFTRDAWSPLGSSDGVMYVHKDLKEGMNFKSLTVNPPPAARGYAQNPRTLQPSAVWGKAGSGRGEFNEPRGLATDQVGNLYVADTKNSRIQKLSPTGEVLAVWGQQGEEPGQFKDPHGIAVGPDGSVYVADTWNHRVQKFDSNGKLIKAWSPSRGSGARAASPSTRTARVRHRHRQQAHRRRSAATACRSTTGARTAPRPGSSSSRSASRSTTTTSRRSPTPATAASSSSDSDGTFQRE
jgi:hypothetical protein